MTTCVTAAATGGRDRHTGSLCLIITAIPATSLNAHRGSVSLQSSLLQQGAFPSEFRFPCKPTCCNQWITTRCWILLWEVPQQSKALQGSPNVTLFLREVKIVTDLIKISEWKWNKFLLSHLNTIDVFEPGPLFKFSMALWPSDCRKGPFSFHTGVSAFGDAEKWGRCQPFTR